MKIQPPLPPETSRNFRQHNIKYTVYINVTSPEHAKIAQNVVKTKFFALYNVLFFAKIAIFDINPERGLKGGWKGGVLEM